MADWSTVAIAIVSAGAALGGVWMKALHDEKLRRKEEARADVGTLRLRLEELLLETDRLTELVNRNNLTYMLSVAKKEPLKGEIVGPSFAKIRALITLHFPECQAALKGFDEREDKIGAMFVEAMERKKNAEVVGIVMSQKRTESINTLAREVRSELAAIASSIGLTVANLPSAE